ncbi:multicopper oxidase family protein [Cohnella xylanilytica]|uniref:Copper-containing nitrite reductase n=1 Tax=Cohnella xylanilytica TaxID=557555 RepID=A0A841TSJ7_9BACL|nr:multicopper oxidase family protein [Cohnella xylanilytica]MBB6689792.1 multicopper oxidase family protein [Cohnella xylanilytica]
MYGLLVSIEMASLLILALLGWMAGNLAYKLAHAPSGDRLRRQGRRLIVWTVATTLAAAAATGSVVAMAVAFDRLFWLGRVLLQAPLAAVPLLFVWLVSVPKLRRMLRDPGLQDAAAPIAPAFRRAAAEPGLATAYRASALGALTAFYYVLNAPVPFDLAEATIPLLVYAAAMAAIWFGHYLRGERAGRAAHAPGAFPRPPLWKRGLRGLAIAAAVVAAAAVPLTIGASTSPLPDRIDMTAGPMDDGKGNVAAAHDHGSGHAAHLAATADAAPAPVSVADLTGPDSEPDRRFTLTAQKKTVRLASGQTIEAWTYDGQIPGPELRVKEGEVVEVTLVNKDIDAGSTIHWHGLDVPNAEDGVAGVTQNAVMPGERHTYRFKAEQVGTFWYHTHQDSLEGVSKGLFGSLVVEPAHPDPDRAREKDITVMTHLWDDAGIAIGASDGVDRVRIAPGTPVRLRLINTDNWIRQTYRLVGSDFQVAAIDGTDLNEPGDLAGGTKLVLTTGGRYDVTFVMPDRPVFLGIGFAAGSRLGILMSPDGSGDIPDAPSGGSEFDPLHYGKPAKTPFGPDSAFDREFTMVLDNKLGFYDGKFEMLYTLNGEVFPNTPAFMVREGDLVKTTIVNRGMVDHPMHLHGHHVLVLSRNGEPADGSPWWSDTLDVLPGDTYEIAFRADNPGVWMDHCHNLTHAVVGMTMHLMYEGVTTPYEAGRSTGNHPE